MYKSDLENANPHKAAVAAIWLYGPEYSKQRGGSMDFWDGLSEQKKSTCRQLVEDIIDARPEQVK